MRKKEQILKDSKRVMNKGTGWDDTASTHERLTIEVLIDIRDILIKQLDPDKAIELIDFELDN